MRGQIKLIKRKESPCWFIYIPKRGTVRAQRISTGETDHSQAERILAQYLLERKRPQANDDARVIDILLRYDAHKSADPTVKANMRSLIPFFKSYYYSQLNNQVFREYTAHRTSQKAVRGKQKADRFVSLATVKRELDTFGAACGFSKREGYIKELVHIEKPPASVPRERFLRPVEFGALVAHSPNQDFTDFLEIMIGTEARPSFVCSLRFDQCDFETRIIDFNPAGNRQNNKYRPSVYMNDHVYKCLKRRLKDAKSDYVFPSRKGGHVKSFKKSFAKACKDAGLTGAGLTPYILRHTAITWVIQQGHGLTRAGQVAGHKDPRTTARYAKHDPLSTRDVTSTLATGALLAHKMAKTLKISPRWRKNNKKKQGA